MDLMTHILKLERRIRQLEANRGASLRYCEVVSVNKEGSARVRLLDGDGMVSHPLRILNRRTGRDKAQWYPDAGEHVACLFAGQGLEHGVILGALYSDIVRSPGKATHIAHYRFEDGTEIAYDREKHQLMVDVQGSVDVRCTEDATVRGDQNVRVTARERLTLEGRQGVSLRGPTIHWDAWDADGGCIAHINADIYHRGLMDREGLLTQRGDAQIDGAATVSSNISAGGSISASGSVTGNPVYGCNH